MQVTSQQIIFPVNGPFLCCCLGLICLNFMLFVCVWMFKKATAAEKMLYTALEFATAVEKCSTLHYNLLLQWKKNFHCSRIDKCSGKIFSAAVANSSAVHKKFSTALTTYQGCRVQFNYCAILI